MTEIIDEDLDKFLETFLSKEQWKKLRESDGHEAFHLIGKKQEKVVGEKQRKTKDFS